ncbi:MAG: hypothetical protein WCA56_02470 [Xanthobacteraceae bacterium]
MTRTRFTFAIGLFLACAAAATAAQSAGPGADYAIDTEYTATSPDHSTTVEQYSKTDADGDYTWQFWARHRNELTLLAPQQPDYRADFRFTADSQWLVRMQTTGSGEETLYLYRLGPQGFAAATAKPLGDLAWAYFNSRPDSRKIRKPDFHMVASLVKGAGDNYRSIGETWPDSRYLVITLSGEVSPNGQHGQLLSLTGWHCRYDLQKGAFDVPPDFAANNAKAVAPAK